MKGLSGVAAEEIVRMEASEVIAALGLSASLTPSRNNGFLNMLRLMQSKALAHLSAPVHPYILTTADDQPVHPMLCLALFGVGLTASYDNVPGGQG